MVLTRRRLQRRQAAQDADINRLSDELILTIFDFLDGSSKSAILTATRVCIQWHALAQRMIDGTIGPLTFSHASRKRNGALFNRLQKDAAFRQRVHHVSISDWYLRDMDFHSPPTVRRDPPGNNPYVSGRFFSDNWSERHRTEDPTMTQLRLLIKTIGKLQIESFTWQAVPSMPIDLCQALKAQRSCLIRLERNKAALNTSSWSYTPYINTVAIECLQLLTPTITSLEVVLPAADAALLQRFGNLVRQCPKLRSLKVRAIKRMWTNPSVPHALETTSFSKFIAVQSLDWLLNAAAGDCRVMTLETLELDNFCTCGADTSTWDLNLDWNKLSSLSTNCVTLLEHCTWRSTALRRLCLRLDSARDDTYPTCQAPSGTERIHTALLTVPELSTLDLLNGTSILDEALFRHLGRHLHSLSVHEETLPSWPLSERLLLSLDLIKRLATHCTRLAELSLDVPYSDPEYRRYLDTISLHLGQLHCFTVARAIELYGTDQGEFPRSASNIQSAVDDFKHLRQSLRRLNCLQVSVTSNTEWDRNRTYMMNKNARLDEVRHIVVEMDSTSALGLSAQSLEVEEARQRQRHGASGPYPAYWEHELGQAIFMAENERWHHYVPPIEY